MITQVFRVIFFIIGAVAVLFTGNAFLGSDRLWNYIDYSAISEQAAIDSAREITVCMPTEMTVKGTHNVVKLKKGDKVKLLARYQKYLVPIVRSGDYLPTFNFVVMLPDSTICMGKLPEALIGATAVKMDSAPQELEITGLKPSNHVSYEQGGEKATSKYNFWVVLSDGSRMAFEQVTWKRIGFTRYNARGRWELSDTAQAPKVVIDQEEMNEARYKPDDTVEGVVGSRPVGFYKLRNGFTDSGHFKTWSARGVAGVVEAIILIIVLIYLPIIVHKVIYRLPGKNWMIIFVSWITLIAAMYLLSSYAVTSFFNHIFFLYTICSIIMVKSDVESSRCKYCGGVDCLRQMAGTPKRTYTWSGGWKRSKRQVAEVVESTIQDGVTVSTTRKAIYKNTEERNHGSTTTWGEAYYCTKCHMRYEYTRKEHSSSTESRDLESDGQALNRNSWGAH